MNLKIYKHNISLNFGGIAVKILLLWLIIAFLVYPNINMIFNIVYHEGSFSTEIISKLLSSQRAMKAMLNSFILAVSMIITVNLVGILLVIFTEYIDIKGAKILKLGYMSNLIYSGIVLVSGYNYVYGSTGIFTIYLVRLFPEVNPDWFSGYGAVIFIMTFACTFNHVIFLTNAIRGIDFQIVEAARNMGASQVMIFTKIVLPTLKPTIFALTVLTFIIGLSAISAPLIVGGTSFQTINPMILTFARSYQSRDLAALMSIILGMSTTALLALLNYFEKGGNYISVSKTKSKIIKQKISNPISNGIVHTIAYLIFVIFLFPMFMVILYSFSTNDAIRTGRIGLHTFTFEHYQRLLTSANAFRPFVISIVYASMAAVIVVLLAVIVSRVIQRGKGKLTAFFEYGMLIPWLLPSTMIALGLMTTYDSPRAILFNQVLIGTNLILLVGYVIIRIPFSLRMIKASLYSVDKSLEEAAQCMGSRTLNTMRRVILPIILPAVLSVIALNLNNQLAEFELTVLLYHPLLEPLGPVIRSASDETATLDAQAMSFVYAVALMILSSVSLYIVFGKKSQFKKYQVNRLRKKMKRERND